MMCAACELLVAEWRSHALALTHPLWEQMGPDALPEQIWDAPAAPVDCATAQCSRRATPALGLEGVLSARIAALGA